jgi:hypothetical protein
MKTNMPIVQLITRGVFVTAALSLLAIGCSGGSGGGGGTGQVQVQVMDAPFTTTCFAEALVTVDRIEIQPTGSQGNGGWTTVTTTAQTFDLLDLTAGVSQTAAFATVPAGRYHQIRLNIVDATLVWADGATRSFTIPSGEVKIIPKPQIVIVPGQTTNLMLDFDVARSFVVTGTPTTDCDALKQAGKIMFTPLIRAINRDASGVVSGVITDGATGGGFPGVTISANDGTNPPVTTLSATGAGPSGTPAGEYALLLDPGTYSLSFEAPGRTTVSQTATVEAGRVVNLDVTIP